MQDDDLAVALEDGRRVPRYHPSVLQQDFGLVDDGEVAVGTGGGEGRGARGGSERSMRGIVPIEGSLSGAFTCCTAPGLVSRCRLKGL